MTRQADGPLHIRIVLFAQNHDTIPYRYEDIAPDIQYYAYLDGWEGFGG
jgi:hypothetical protein